MKTLNCERKDYVVTTKLFWEGRPAEKYSVNATGLSRHKIVTSMKNSLEKLQLEYVDLVLAHRFDLHVPLEEICIAFSYLIDQGKAFYWGTSTWPNDMIAAAIEYCRAKGLHEPVLEQPEYNLVTRSQFEEGMRRIYERYGYGTSTYSPLAGGILTGKYNDGIPESSRYDKYSVPWYFNEYFSPDKTPKKLENLKALKAYAEELGYSMV